MGKLVFTNGCFDILHAGHVDFLGRAAAFGERLVVGINSDESVTRIKGVGRPVNTAEARRAVLLGLAAVDDVVIFAEPTPERLIHEISPDVLVKGGDWPVEQIIGAEFVLAKGGEVHSIPLLGNYSTSAVIEKIAAHDAGSPDGPESAALQAIEEHLLVMQEMRRVCLDAIERSGSAIVDALSSGNKILICGNGGSAADAQHIAAELVGRFEGERRGLPAIALTTDTSALTAIGNDYGFEFLYSRQVEALAKAGDVVVCISTSGNSPNILAACMKARQIGCTTIALTGAGGSKLASLCDEAVLVPSQRTARIQEGHITIGHIWCGMVDAALGESA